MLVILKHIGSSSKVKGEMLLKWSVRPRVAVFGRPFVKRFALCYRSVVLSVLSVCLSVCLSVTLVYCGQMVGRIKTKFDMQVGLGIGHTVLDGDLPPPPLKGHSPPQFSAHICCGQMAAWIKMPLGMELCLGPGDFVLDGDAAPPLQKGGGAPPQLFCPCLLC